jgi:hypothetical protein
MIGGIVFTPNPAAARAAGRSGFAGKGDVSEGSGRFIVVQTSTGPAHIPGDIAENVTLVRVAFAPKAFSSPAPPPPAVLAENVTLFSVRFAVDS